MAKEKIKIEITLEEGISAPSEFIKRDKIKRQVPLVNEGEYTILDIHDASGEHDLFSIKLGKIYEVEIK